MNSLPLPPTARIARILRSALEGTLRAGTDDFEVYLRLMAVFERNDNDAAILTEKVL